MKTAGPPCCEDLSGERSSGLSTAPQRNTTSQPPPAGMVDADRVVAHRLPHPGHHCDLDSSVTRSTNRGARKSHSMARSREDRHSQLCVSATLRELLTGCSFAALDRPLGRVRTATSDRRQRARLDDIRPPTAQSAALQTSRSRKQPASKLNDASGLCQDASPRLDTPFCFRVTDNSFLRDRFHASANCCCCVLDDCCVLCAAG